MGMTSQDVKNTLIEATKDIESVLAVANKLDAALRILNNDNTAITLMTERLDKVRRSLWDLEFSDFSPLDDLNVTFNQEEIVAARLWYTAAPYVKRMHSDDSYSMYSWDASWDELSKIEKMNVIQKYRERND